MKSVSRATLLVSLLAFLFAGCSSFIFSRTTAVERVSVYFATTREHAAAASPQEVFRNTGTKKEHVYYGTARPSHDHALLISGWLHDFQREGEVETQGQAKRVDVIDASAARTDWLGHSYDGPVLFEDIRSLLRGLTLDQRLDKTLSKNRSKGVYALLKELGRS